MQQCSYAGADSSKKRKQTAAMESFHPQKDVGNGAGGGGGVLSHGKGGAFPIWRT